MNDQFVCVNCSMIMTQRQCKVRCPRCGYFEDCSDGGNDNLTNFIQSEEAVVRNAKLYVPTHA